MEKICKKHGLTDHALRTDGRYRCRRCNVEAVQKRRDVLKIKAVHRLGGKCEICNYDKHTGALEFHHRNPKEKDFSISKSGYIRSWERVKNEIDKCVLLCANCHREVHAGVAQLAERHTVNMEDGLGSNPPASAKPRYRCIDCGTEIDPKATRCVECSLKIRRKVKSRPSKSQLEKDIRLSSYRAVGRKYGVSDNAIRKWLK